MDDKLREIEQNVTEMRENIADLHVAQQRDDLVLYGSEKIHVPSLIKRVEDLEVAIKNINGMPAQVKILTNKVDTLIETDKRRVNIIKGAALGYGIQAGGLIAVLFKVFS